MKAKLRLAGFVAAVALLLAGGVALVLWLLWLDLDAAQRAQLAPILAAKAGLLGLALVMATAAFAMLARGVFRNHVDLPARLAENALLMLDANPAHRVEPDGPPELRQIGVLINRMADQCQQLRRDVDEQVRAAMTSVEEEKSRLAALMSELSQSVVVCNLDGRILLYNNRARLQFMALGDSAGGGTLIGLGRSVFTVLDRGLINHALENIQHRLRREGSQPVANFVTTTRAGQLLRVQMAPVMAVPATAQSGAQSGELRALGGYVLMLDNITRHFENEARRDQLLQQLTEGSRASLGAIRAAVETLSAYPDMDAGQRDAFVKVIADETRAMSQRLNATVTEFADALKARWPLEEMYVPDLVQACQRRIEARLALPTKTEEIDDGLWVKVDSFSLIQALTYLSSRLKGELEAREVRFRLQAEGRLAHLDLIWSGTPVSSETLMGWELEPMAVDGETSPLSLRDVMERHDGEIWVQRETTRHRQFFRLALPVATPQETVAAELVLRGESRPEYYDFDLFHWRESSRDLEDRLLTDLTFTVFDTETTGLDPSAGDEIIQIGAMRIVNGRLLRSESFDQLVDPRRTLNPESARIHGITPAMLAGKPVVDDVLPAFHAWCEDTVLVAHNAAFDMRFLQMKEARTGVRFTQPVLDTLLLSAVVHPNQESHRLEAIAERLGIPIVGRHNALGDAIVTGEVLLKLIPLLAEQGIRTLRHAREASEKSYYARITY
jgi:DNA polymerase-3 subunit epsilon